MATATVNGIELSYRQSGEAADVILVHGLGANMAFWPPAVWRGLSAEHRIVAYDLRGHGYSEMPASGYTTAHMAEDLLGLMDHIGIERAHLVGHSYGGAVALHFAVLHPERAVSLTLADARIAVFQPRQTIRDLPHWEHWWECFRAAGIEVEADQPLDYTLIEVLAAPQWRDARQTVKVGTYFVPFGGWNGGSRTAQRWLRLLDQTTARADFTVAGGLTREAIRGVDLPVLAMYGEYSHCLDSFRGLRENLPNCTAVQSPGSGHFHPFVKPDVFVQNLRPFLT